MVLIGRNEKETPVLPELFEHQAELNRRIGFDPVKLKEKFDPQLAGQWLNLSLRVF